MKRETGSSVTLRLPESIKSGIQQIALQSDRSFTQQVVSILRQYLSQTDATPK